MIDTHAHLDFKFDDDITVDKIVAEAAEDGVKIIICACSSVDSLEKTTEIANKYSGVYHSLGVHPHDSKDFNADVDRMFFDLYGKKCVAIGETGLDYYYEHSPGTIQKKVFARETEIARELGLPLIVHSREADRDTYEILKSEYGDTCNGVIHCYTGNREQLKKYLDMGMYVSFTGIITFPKTAEIADAARYAPDDRIMVETDAPFLAPVPFRGKINYPKYVVRVAEKLAEIRERTPEEIAAITTRNARAFFGL